jgi:hypothetical protein
MQDAPAAERWAQTKAAMLDQLLETGSSPLSCVEGHMLGDVGSMKDPYLTNGSCIAAQAATEAQIGGKHTQARILCFGIG